MNKVVVDANVGLKWFFEEELKEKADLIIARAKAEQVIIVVPQLFYTECANGLWKRVRKKVVTWDTAEKILDRLLKMPFKRYDEFEVCDVALENALRFGISVYDAIYLSVAEVHAAPFITADRKLFEACQNRYDFIEYLGNMRA